MFEYNTVTPDEAKKELLDKYPAKVAKEKDQKQIVVNKVEKSDSVPEVQSQYQKTIPGIITQRGCCYAGCKGVVIGPNARHSSNYTRTNRMRLL